MLYIPTVQEQSGDARKGKKRNTSFRIQSKSKSTSERDNGNGGNRMEDGMDQDGAEWRAGVEDQSEGESTMM